MKKLLIVIVFLLSACGPSKEERQADFMAQCTSSDFTPKQCAFFFTLVEDQRSANNTNAVFAGVAATNAALAATRVR